MQNHEIETNSELLIIWRWKHLIDFNFYQNYRQRYTVIPITTVRGPYLFTRKVQYLRIRTIWYFDDAFCRLLLEISN